MSEEIEKAGSGSEGNGAGIDPAAVALALAGASREDAHEFLKKQGHLVDLQAKELAHELELRHWSLLVCHLSSLLKLTLEVSVARCLRSTNGWSQHSANLCCEFFQMF